MNWLIFILLVFSTKTTLAWTGRGHFEICQAAALLVENPDLKSFLRSRSHIMGHLCNVPDNVWKN
jgi:hypothetical protein